MYVLFSQEVSIHKKKFLLPFLHVLEGGGWEEKGGTEIAEVEPLAYSADQIPGCGITFLFS